MPYMDQQVKKLWLDALRSGKYRQGFGKLIQRNTEGHLSHCATGVLLKLYMQDARIYPPGIDDPDFLKWAGLPVNGLILMHNKQCLFITSLNDDYRLTFKQIADLIEEQL